VPLTIVVMNVAAVTSRQNQANRCGCSRFVYIPFHFLTLLLCVAEASCLLLLEYSSQLYVGVLRNCRVARIVYCVRFCEKLVKI